MVWLEMICIFVHHRIDAEVGATLLAIRAAAADHHHAGHKEKQQLIHKLMDLVASNEYTYVAKFMQDAQ